MMRQATVSNPDPVGPEPPGSPPRPGETVALFPGDCLQAAVDSAPEGATFLIKSGRHQPNTSKGIGGTGGPPGAACETLSEESNDSP